MSYHAEVLLIVDIAGHSNNSKTSSPRLWKAIIFTVSTFRQ